MEKVKWLLFSASVLLLAACSNNTSVEEVFAWGIEAHETVESMQLETEGTTESIDIQWLAQMNVDEGVYSLLYDEYLEVYKDDELVVGVIDDEELDEYSIGFLIEKVINEYEYVLKRFDHYVEDVNEAFELEVEEEHYILTYNGDDEQQQQLAEQLVNDSMKILVGEDVEIISVDVEQLEFTFTIDKETNLIATFEQKVSLDVQFNDEWFLEDRFLYDEHLTTTYTQYNEMNEIERPVQAEATVAEVEDDAISIDLSAKEIEVIEEEAATYVDALIQATVFQNADGFGEIVAGSRSDDDKQADGEFQRDSFVEFYRQNTKRNMGDHVSDELIDELADSYMNALSQTDYEVIDAQLIDDEQIIVTLSITGLFDSLIMYEIEHELTEAIELGDENVDNWLEYQVELMIDAYNGPFVEGQTTEATVHVLRDSDGAYHVLMQDEYLLGGFVQ
ncbi:DUF6612 family protein [Halalkalibacter hemicellulosilyticus]|uniref:Lipoprotein n=1 Tax=Halalkalibacter hemicellulosilyticusJCM 9152 TaxID=1236971 RepID=W4QDX2_9BACI|nr:DUF6612 family protein [Halalkalibacter hemicellulosilyticus]GAE30256.1 hypothetical protein JCM9152_1658 [Halalkalibacter hemicellulosilyticusJCM 9152]